MIWYVRIQTILKHVLTCSNMSKLIQIQYDMNCYNSYESQTNMSELVQTCLNLFRFNMIWIVAIHVILKHVWTCWNMPKLGQIQYDMNCHNSYDSQTCLYLFRFNIIWIVKVHMILKYVLTCSNLPKLVVIWIVTSYDEIL